jgi:hypothetical protein
MAELKFGPTTTADFLFAPSPIEPPVCPAHAL